jgi:hypothetical protein
VGRWARERPRFGEALLAARRAAGGPFVGGRSSYCVETAQAIFDRVCAGEALTAICRDADMPVAATVYKWRAERPEFAQALAEAMALRAEGFFERGWEMAEAATPDTAYLTHVRLTQLRWHVGKLAPKKYGAPQQMADGETKDGGGLTVVVKKFVLDDDTPGGRESDEPAQVLYRLTAEQVAGEIVGEHPAVAAWEADEPEREAGRTAFARAKAAALADGVAVNGTPPAQYWDRAEGED